MEQLSGYITHQRIKYVVSKRPYIASSKVHGGGSKYSALPSLALIFTCDSQITLSMSATQNLAS